MYRDVWGNVFNFNELLRIFVGDREFENYLPLLITKSLICPVLSIRTNFKVKEKRA